ncbi:hypothetical protein NQ315_004206 [Exocentrus adspersus]|uniref:Complement component 1 Q subcomponent-binding protein, mitochondrial n=1 Tax=Exocentrus adspersus TaxID=1586481 RepID=A0AAV8W6I7_9CUCU|nr:hypothetical protein NQ315_004206 [Exocentrus adspersus]
MNNVFKTAIKLNGLRSLLNPLKSKASVAGGIQQKKFFARNLWYMCESRYEGQIQGTKNNYLCSCGCGGRGIHTKGEKELVEFLTEEILAERKAQKVKTIPTELGGFKANLNGAEVTLTKQADNENIKIIFNVNHSVDTDAEPGLHENLDKPDIGELKSKPSFRIELVKGNTTLSLACSFINPNDQEDGYNDVFGIDELSIYEDEWNENIYAVSGEVIDSYLYDLVLNYLEEKGITNEFVEKLSDYSTSYEHSAYISLLEGLSKFVSGK